MYKLMIMEDEEFDRLPYKYAKEALGCADPKTNTAYVRRVHWGEASKVINLLTIEHEIDELVAKVSPHEEDGIRYKKGNAIASIIAPLAIGLLTGGTGFALAPWFGSTATGALLSGATSAAMAGGKPQNWLTSGALGAVGGGAGAEFGAAMKTGMAAGMEASKAVGGGWIGQTLSGLQGAVGITPGAATTATTMGMPAASGAEMGALDLAKWQSGAGYFYPAAESTTLLGQSTLTGVGKTAGGADVLKGWGKAAATGGVSKLSNIFSNVLTNPSMMLGLSLMGSAALPTTTSIPDIGSITAQWLTSDAVTRAGKIAKDIAETKYLTGTYAPSKESMGLVQVLQGDVDKQYKQRAEDLDRMGLSINENWMTSGDRLVTLQKLEEEKIQTKNAVEKEMLASDYQSWSQNQYNYIIQELNADDQVKRDLLYADLSEVLWKYNIAEEDLLNFRKIAADAGMYLFTGQA